MPGQDMNMLNKEQVALALQNVSHLFGDENANGGSAKEDELKGLEGTGSRRNNSGHSIAGRARVDSTARPPQFMQNAISKKGTAALRPLHLRRSTPSPEIATVVSCSVLMHEYETCRMKTW